MGEINSSFVRPGDNFQFRAETINDMLQMISQWKRGNLAGNSGANSGGRSETIFVKNTTGVDLFAGDVAAIESPLFAAPEIESEDRADIYRHFLDRSYLAVLPTEGKSLAIATGPIPDGQIGRVVISGVVRAVVDVKDTAHKNATFTAGTTALESSESGTLSFLIQPTATGLQWCDLVFGVSGGTVKKKFEAVLYTPGNRGAYAQATDGTLLYCPEYLEEGVNMAPSTNVLITPTEGKTVDYMVERAFIRSFDLTFPPPTITISGASGARTATITRPSGVPAGVQAYYRNDTMVVMQSGTPVWGTITLPQTFPTSVPTYINARFGPYTDAATGAVYLGSAINRVLFEGNGSNGIVVSPAPGTHPPTTRLQLIANNIPATARDQYKVRHRRGTSSSTIKDYTFDTYFTLESFLGTSTSADLYVSLEFAGTQHPFVNLGTFTKQST